MGKKKYILPAVLGGCALLCMAGIFLASSQNIGQSNALSGSLADAILGNQSDAVRQMANYLLRKAAHFSSYALLAALLTLIQLPFSTRPGTKWLSAFLCSGFYAALDEWHQTFVPGRTGSLRDVAIDLCGAALGAGLVLFIVSIRKKRKHHRQERS